MCLPLAVPAALVGSPSISPLELPRNLWDGWMCYLGYNSVVLGEHPDNCWPGGPLYVTLYLVANINFNILIIMVRRRVRGQRFRPFYRQQVCRHFALIDTKLLGCT